MTPCRFFHARLVSSSLVPGLWLQAQSTSFFVNSRNRAGIGTTTLFNHLDVAAHGGQRSNEGTAQIHDHLLYNVEKLRFKFRPPA
jgi:hypothetical protein